VARPEGVPVEFYRDVIVTTARQHLAEAEAIDYDTAPLSVLAGHVGGLAHCVRELLAVLDDQEAGR
jgi:hypothetical protein